MGQYINPRQRNNLYGMLLLAWHRKRNQWDAGVLFKQWAQARSKCYWIKETDTTFLQVSPLVIELCHYMRLRSRQKLTLSMTAK